MYELVSVPPGEPSWSLVFHGKAEARTDTAGFHSLRESLSHSAGVALYNYLIISLATAAGGAVEGNRRLSVWGFGKQQQQQQQQQQQ